LPWAACRTWRPGRCIVQTLLERRDALLLIAAELGKVGFHRLQPVAVLLRLPDDVGHLPFERVEPLV
jgi:hypothetical protein